MRDDLLEQFGLNLGEAEHRPAQQLGGVVFLGVLLETAAAGVAARDPNAAFQFDGSLGLQVGAIEAPTPDRVKAVLSNQLRPAQGSPEHVELGFEMRHASAERLPAGSAVGPARRFAEAAAPVWNHVEGVPPHSAASSDTRPRVWSSVRKPAPPNR